MPCPHVTEVRYHVYRIEMIELVADIPDLGYPLFYAQGRIWKFAALQHVTRAVSREKNLLYSISIGYDSIMKQGGTTTKIVPGKS